MSDDVTIWSALADTKRRQIVNLLEEKPRTTSELSKYFEVTRFAVMKHLTVLEKADLIKVERQGRTRWNFLNVDFADFLRTKLADDKSARLVDILGLFPGKGSGPSVSSSKADHFFIEQKVLLQATPAQVFTALTEDINGWWGQRISTHSQVVMEPFVNGRFYEEFSAAGHSILYATVTTIKQGQELRLRGTLEFSEQVANAPAPDNHVHIILEPQDNATQLSLRHYLGGSVEETVGAAFKHHWHILLNHYLIPFIEKGIRYQGT